MNPMNLARRLVAALLPFCALACPPAMADRPVVIPAPGATPPPVVTPAPPAAPAATRPAFQVHYAISHVGAPDARTLPGDGPIYVVYDGSLNRACVPGEPEGKYNFPAADGSNRRKIEWALRKIARAAAGVEDDTPYGRNASGAQNRIPQDEMFDLEGPEFGALSVEADPAKRRQVVEVLRWYNRVTRSEWRAYGHEGKLGYFLYPPAMLVTTSPFDPGRAAMEIAAYKDLLPLFDGKDEDDVDFFAFPAYRGAESNVDCIGGLKRRVALCRAYAPQIPVRVVLTPLFQAGPNWLKPIPADEWAGLIDAARQVADGVILWSGADLSDRTGNARLPWPAGGPDWLKPLNR